MTRTTLIAALAAPLALAACIGPFGKKGPELIDIAEVDANGYRTVRNDPGYYDEDALETTRAAPDILAALRQSQQEAEAAARAQARQQQAAARPTQRTPGLQLCDVVQAPQEVQFPIMSLPPLGEVRGKTLMRAPVTEGCIVVGFGMADARGRPSGGLDFYGGGQVLAAADGSVVGFAEIGDFGLTLVVDHGDGVRTRYANLASIADGVVRGAQVSRGQRIAVMGNSGSLAENGVHYELEVDGQRIDPLSPPPPGQGN